MSNLNMHAAVGAGKHRNPWRIREWLSLQGMTMADVARDVGVVRSVVSETVKGNCNNRRVLRYLAEMGCPAKHLSLPSDIAGAA